MNESSSEQRYGNTFGTGSFVETILRDEDFFEKPVSEQALAIGWADGCPIPEQLIASNEAGRGPEAMRQRYAEVNFWFTTILNEVERLNPALYEKLTMNFPRYTGEFPITYEPESVPDSYLDRMAPMDTLWGYAIPRVLIEQFKGNGETSLDDKQAAQNRLVKGLEILEEVVVTSPTPVDLLVNLSERVAQADADPKAVLHHALSQGKFNEENSPTMWEFVAVVMKDQAPDLWEVYSSLTPDEKRKNDIYSSNLTVK